MFYKPDSCFATWYQLLYISDDRMVCRSLPAKDKGISFVPSFWNMGIYVAAYELRADSSMEGYGNRSGGAAGDSLRCGGSLTGADHRACHEGAAGQPAVRSVAESGSDRLRKHLHTLCLAGSHSIYAADLF